jgi:hypothetical protein
MKATILAIALVFVCGCAEPKQYTGKIVSKDYSPGWVQLMYDGTSSFIPIYHPDEHALLIETFHEHHRVTVSEHEYHSAKIGEQTTYWK